MSSEKKKTSFLDLALQDMAAGKYARAQEVLEALVLEEPDNCTAWSALGNVLAAQGLRQQACQAWSRCLEIEPGMAAALVGLAWLAHDLKGTPVGERAAFPTWRKIP